MSCVAAPSSCSGHKHHAKRARGAGCRTLRGITICFNYGFPSRSAYVSASGFLFPSPSAKLRFSLSLSFPLSISPFLSFSLSFSLLCSLPLSVSLALALAHSSSLPLTLSLSGERERETFLPPPLFLWSFISLPLFSCTLLLLRGIRLALVVP